MVDIQYVKLHTQEMREIMKNRNLDPAILDAFLVAEKELKLLQKKIEETNRTKNENAEKLMKLADKKSDEARTYIEQGKRIKETIQEYEVTFVPLEKKYQELALQLPNFYSADTPIGKDESENVPIRKVGTPPVFTFKPLDHYELGSKLGLFDNEHAAKISGARFTYVKGKAALLEFALVQLVMQTVTNEEILKQIIAANNLAVKATPFIPVIPPVFIKPEVMQRMGRLEPRDDRYHTEADDLYLIGSAEHTLGPLHMDEMMKEEELPIRYIGFSTAFRREAGSYGKDTKGIFRVHQFDKLEMESFTLPERSFDEQLLFVAIQEYLVQRLGLAYQVVSICTGDMGTPDARQFDIETWIPSQNTYRETHTSDLMTDYQARRLNIRVKRTSEETQYVHMNDATAFAIGRILIAIVENYQQEDGSIQIPSALLPFMPFGTEQGYIR